MSYSTIIKIKTKEHTVTPPSQKRDEDENNYVYSLFLTFWIKLLFFGIVADFTY